MIPAWLLGAFYALLTADVPGGIALVVLAATGVLTVTLRRGQARPRQEAGR